MRLCLKEILLYNSTIMSKPVKHHYHHSKSRKLHEHEYHSPVQLAFNRVFVAPAINPAPINDPDNDGDNDSGDTDNDSGK